MYLVYGSYQHDPGDAEVHIFREGVLSELGRMYAIKERWQVEGRLHGADTATVNAMVTALMSAYSINNQDIYLYGSNHIMRAADTINGTRVVVPPSFPQGRGAELSTFRTYTLAVEGEFPYYGDSVLLSWAEAISFVGTGGPSWGFLETLVGPPQMQVFQQRTVVKAKQAGRATCDHRGYWPPQPPLWPQWEHQDRRTISYELPASPFAEKITTWAYDFSANIPLTGWPGTSPIFRIG